MATISFTQSVTVKSKRVSKEITKELSKYKPAFTNITPSDTSDRSKEVAQIWFNPSKN